MPNTRCATMASTRVLDLRLGATIGEAGREPPDQTDRPIGRAEQQRRRRPR